MDQPKNIAQILPSTLPSAALDKVSFPRLDRKVFDLAISNLEAARQENFAVETLNVWYAEFCRLGWSQQEFESAVLRVMRSKAFGTTKFGEFIDGSRVYSQKEVESLITSAVAAKLESFGDLDEAALYREGLRLAETNFYRRVEEFIDRVREEAEGRVDGLRHWFLGADEETQARVIWIVAQKNPVIAKDKFYESRKVDFTKLLLHTVLDEVEKIKNEKT